METPTSSRRSRCRVVFGLSVLFAALAAIWMPAPGAWHNTIPVGEDVVATVPLFNVWTIWWNFDRLQHGFAGYWNAPIFFPEQATFAFSEPQPATLLVAPVIWLSDSRVLAYNVYLWLSLMLNGLVASLILLSGGHRVWLAILGGVGVLLLPIVHTHMDVLQLIPLWGVLWTWSALHRLGTCPSWCRGAELGLALGVSFALSIHHGMFLGLLLCAAPILIVSRWRDRRLYASLFATAAFAAVLILPLILPLRAALKQHDFQRTTQRASGLSAQPADYLAISDQSLWRPLDQERHQRFRLSPGTMKLALAGFGLIAAVVRRRRRRWTIFLAATTILAFGLSLGPHLQLGVLQPWEQLRTWCPGVAQVRSVFRFAYFAQLAVVLLAIEGAHLLWLFSCRWPRGRLLKCFFSSSVVILTVVAALESWPRRPDFAGTPSASVNEGWMRFVSEETTTGRGIVCIPFAIGSGVADFAQTTRWMYLGTFHGVPLVNGYSGYFPRSNEVLRDVMQRGFSAPEVLDILVAANVQYLVVQTVLTPISTATEQALAVRRVEQVYEDESGVIVYRLP